MRQTTTLWPSTAAPETLQGLERTLAGATSPEQALAAGTEHAARVFGFDASAGLITDSAGHLRPAFVSGLPHAAIRELARLYPAIPLVRHSMTDLRARVGRLEPAPGLPRWSDVGDKTGLTTMAVVPIVAGQRLIGVAVLLSRRPAQRMEPLVPALDQVAERTGAAMAREAARAAMTESCRLAATQQLSAGLYHELEDVLDTLEGGVDVKATAAAIRRLAEGLRRGADLEPAAAGPVAVDDLVRATRELVAAEAARSEVVIGVEVARDLPPVRACRRQIVRALVALATNAIEAMTAGGRLALRATLRDSQHGARLVAIDVEDTGPGIAAEALPRIWGPFFTSKPERLGLGLMAVRGLVGEQPGAAVTVASVVGRGTTFTLTLPALDPADGPPSLAR
jgi:signal transduction histidine kinase